MKLTKFFLALFIFVNLSGCVATVPKILPNGKYAQMYVQGVPFLQIEYPDAQSCATSSNMTESLDMNARKAINDGLIRFDCSPRSLSETLTHSFKIVSVLTGSVFPSRSVSREACMLMAEANTERALRYDC